MLAAKHRARLAMADDNPDTREATLRSVRRRLFTEDVDDKSTTPNKDEIEKQFMEEEAQLLAEKKAKWNFDFKEERPLDGQWQWERIGKSSDKQRTNGGASARDAPENADANTQRTSGDARKQAP